MRKFAVAGLMAAVSTASLVTATPAGAAPTSVYVSTTGSNSASGTKSRPVRTIGEALKRVRNNTNLTTVRIFGGTYRPGASFSLSKAYKQKSITFTRVGGSTAPVIKGTNGARHLDYFLKVAADGPRIHMKRLIVQYYRTGGVLLKNDRNTFTGTQFSFIGNAYAGTGDGYAGIHMNAGSSYNIVDNVSFLYLKNVANECPGCMHGVYIADQSHHNTVKNSTFQGITGDPVRLRRSSSDNLIDHNQFRRSGTNAMVSYWVHAKDGSFHCGARNTVTNNTYSTMSDETKPGIIVTSGADDGMTSCPAAIPTVTGNTKA
ncbi:right-handed parallel beta-helix repeat-containing protein [Streptomyces sp. DASNCL29]|uniref:right-handed parallel beta-helix repeat-containing protein n=1 Tax=Streptomyces sp. DASNCL29 TaxID=2583819 RepID=UPI001485EC8B|nr:right-handed parallel beta-helix repeat-containing protein [Streptomyces sp. DASNCL29]